MSLTSRGSHEIAAGSQPPCETNKVVRNGSCARAPDEHRLHSLLQRLDGLENRVRRLRAILFSLLLLLAALPLLAFATRTDEIVGSKFTLVDEKGKARAYWQARAGEDGDPALVMLNRDGKEQIELSVTKTEALCVLRDQRAMNRVGMAVADYPHLMLSDEHQKPRMHLTVGKLGGPTILFIHEDGSFPGGIGVEGDGTPWIKPDRWKALLDAEGHKAGSGVTAGPPEA